jgi:hypothetical protein
MLLLEGRKELAARITETDLACASSMYHNKSLDISFLLGLISVEI